MFKYTIKFRREPSQPYVVITPWTPLAELEQFLQDKLFALGVSGPIHSDTPAKPFTILCSDGLGSKVCPCCGHQAGFGGGSSLPDKSVSLANARIMSYCAELCHSARFLILTTVSSTPISPPANCIIRSIELQAVYHSV